MKITEKLHQGQHISLDTALSQLQFNAEGLISAVAQQHDTGEVLMLAWMNREALLETLTTKRVCYWSRSRQRLWRKGESSGQTQHLIALYADCDGDSVLLKVDQHGPACHTGRRSCFYNLFQEQQVIVDSEPLIAPETLYRHV
ncbi:phosphoribosyl-AMP cyclohydrolase [Thioflexithrix psekupsensis]|uniref:Phosphoribosyl-AMP cyclohydrolase n=1 Tax=Thioflexithrix psekupsensis TaxID=1570016 RepID=A0A251XB52_9GAMM|nr:phosphoribosyl-AMP cyclohydrolase [Thioflexithrix psekupsensis]OUD15387.1 phosphoribosyl-AMP cyclohydrolase [Thioflexithrix psekupsensis]